MGALGLLSDFNDLKQDINDLKQDINNLKQKEIFFTHTDGNFFSSSSDWSTTSGTINANSFITIYHIDFISDIRKVIDGRITNLPNGVISLGVYRTYFDDDQEYGGLVSEFVCYNMTSSAKTITFGNLEGDIWYIKK